MSHEDAESGHDLKLSARCDRACAALIEERWRRAPGLALRIGMGASGVVERPGRTRFDLQWLADERCFHGPLRTRWPWLPLADGALAILRQAAEQPLGSQPLPNGFIVEVPIHYELRK